jgi:hypothetical protein
MSSIASALTNIFNRPKAPAGQNVVMRGKRNIQGIFVDVILSEQHEDRMEITDRPTEGGIVSDHAFAKPKELTMVCAWSNSKPNAGNFGSTPDDIYKKLLDLMNSKQLLSVVTGKRSYNNLLIENIRVETNIETENSLVAEIRFREIIVVQTKTTLIADASNQAAPQKTNPPVNTGTKQLVQAQS